MTAMPASINLLDSLGAQFPMVLMLNIAPDTSTTVAVPPAYGVALLIAILSYSLEEATALDVVFQLQWVFTRLVSLGLVLDLLASFLPC